MELMENYFPILYSTRVLPLFFFQKTLRVKARSALSTYVEKLCQVHATFSARHALFTKIKLLSEAFQVGEIYSRLKHITFRCAAYFQREWAKHMCSELESFFFCWSISEAI